MYSLYISNIQKQYFFAGDQIFHSSFGISSLSFTFLAPLFMSFFDPVNLEEDFPFKALWLGFFKDFPVGWAEAFSFFLSFSLLSYFTLLFRDFSYESDPWSILFERLLFLLLLSFFSYLFYCYSKRAFY